MFRFFLNLFAAPSIQSSLQAAGSLQSVNASPVWETGELLLLLFSADSHPRIPFPCTAFAPQIHFRIAVNQNSGTTKLLVTLEVTEIIGLISSFVLYLHE